MKCARCGFVNHERALSCASCHSPLAETECQSCHTKNVPGSRFCHACGQLLTTKDTMGMPAAAYAERRVVTVLYCDLVDSTALVSGLDPELSREIIRAFLAHGKKIVERAGGHISTYLGDCIVALFYHHEASAASAISAALEISRTVTGKAGPFSRMHPDILVRSGVATGLVVVEDEITDDSEIPQRTAVGPCMNVASEIQRFARPGRIVVDNRTYIVTQGMFKFADAGEHTLKGIRRPEQVWRVIAEKSSLEKLAGQAAVFGPIIGRGDTIRQLQAGWEKSKRALAQTLVLEGGAGLGKTRILQEFIEIISHDQRYYHFGYHCAPYPENVTLNPVVNQIKAAAGLVSGEAPAIQSFKLEDLVRQQSKDFERDMRVYLELLSLADQGPDSRPDSGQGEKKERVFTVVIENILTMAASYPVLVSVEDVHWMDPTTTELLSRMITAFRARPIMLLITCRTGHLPAFLTQPGVKILELAPLNDKHTRQLVSELSGATPLPESLLDEIIKRAEGVPLYIEELSKSVAGREFELNLGGDGKLPLPESLQVALLTRLDQVPPASRSLARVAAVFGRDFSLDLLELVTRDVNNDIRSLLTPLIEARIITQHDAFPGLRFSFRHVLIRDAIYDSLLNNDRAAIHRRIAIAAEQRDLVTTGKHFEMIAYHFNAGGEYRRAVDYWLQAGKIASHNFALQEARELLEAGLDALKKLTQSEDTAALRQDYLITLGPVLMLLTGSESEATRINYSEALALSERLPESRQRFMAMWGKWYISMDYEFRNAVSLANRLESLAQNMQDPDLKLQAYHCQWVTLLYQGRFADTRRYCRLGTSFYHDDRHDSYVQGFGGHDPKVCSQAFSGIALWFIGREQDALAALEQSYQDAHRLGHFGSILNASLLNLLLSVVREDDIRIADWVESLEVICEKFNMPQIQSRLEFARGLLAAHQGSMSSGIDQMLAVADRLSRMNGNEDLPLFHERVAEAMLRAGRLEEAERLLDDTLGRVAQTGLGYWQAELHRRKAHACLQRADHDQAWLHFDRAADTARKQKALALELRAAISVVEFHDQTGAHPAGREELAILCRQFADGCESADLARARALLDTNARGDTAGVIFGVEV